MIVQQSTAYSAQSARPTAAIFQPTRQAASGAAAAITDTVTISKAAREALSSGNNVIPPQEYPVEYYAIPQWQADLMPIELSGKLGAKADELYVKGGNLFGKYDSELSEYSGLLDKHLQALMQKEGIDTVPQYHQAMIVDKESSERLRLLMQDSIAGDKRMTDLMGVLGIRFPADS